MGIKFIFHKYSMIGYTGEDELSVTYYGSSEKKAVFLLNTQKPEVQQKVVRLFERMYSLNSVKIFEVPHISLLLKKYFNTLLTSIDFKVNERKIAFVQGKSFFKNIGDLLTCFLEVPKDNIWERYLGEEDQELVILVPVHIFQVYNKLSNQEDMIEISRIKYLLEKDPKKQITFKNIIILNNTNVYKPDYSKIFQFHSPRIMTTPFFLADWLKYKNLFDEFKNVLNTKLISLY